jgi:rhamnosyltransferase subunit B
MHAILTSIGTDGDVFPYIALGQVLHRRGHRVTLAAAASYCTLASELDLKFVEMISDHVMKDALNSPDMWHPIKSAYHLAKWGVRHLAGQYEILSNLCSSDPGVLIANPGLLAGRLVHDKLGVPLASIVLQPWMIKSSIEPPVMPAGLTLPRWAPKPMASAYWRSINGVIGLLVGPELNRLRRSLGLRAVQQIPEWWFSPDLILALFPDWFGVPQTDWSGNIRICGFPMFDGATQNVLPQEIEDFLNAGPPPVAFTFGTGMMHATRLLKMAVEACAVLGMRGLLLTRHSEQLPQPLPVFMQSCTYAPFSVLFPRGPCIVQQGGVTTVAKCLASGTPSLVMPHAYDQLDNAIRVKRLGCGDYLRPFRASAQKMAERLTGIMNPKTIETCEGVARRFAGVESLEHAADLIEKFAETSHCSTIRSK